MMGCTLPSSPLHPSSPPLMPPPPLTCAGSPLVRGVDGDPIGAAPPLRHLVRGGGRKEVGGRRRRISGNVQRVGLTLFQHGIGATYLPDL